MSSTPLSKANSLTVFQGRAGDRNDLGIPGALALATFMSDRLELPLESVGTCRPALNADWRTELDAATADLRKLADHLALQLSLGKPITVLSRCACAIATIPTVVARHPNACVVWLDAHADLNTPKSSRSGYLGGMALSAPGGLWDSGFGGNLNLSSIVLVGSRDLDPFEVELIASGAVCRIAPEAPNVADAVVEATAHRPVYIHLDCDVLEPGLVPTDFQVSGGLSLRTLHSVCSALSSLTLLGLEIAEFQSRWSASSELASPTALFDAIKPVLDALQQ